METQTPGLVELIPLIFMSILIALMCRHLAKDKGRDVNYWTVLGIIPFVNLFAVPFLVGSTSLVLDKKLDTIIALLERNENEG